MAPIKSTGQQRPMNPAAMKIFDDALKGMSDGMEQVTKAARDQAEASRKAASALLGPAFTNPPPVKTPMLAPLPKPAYGMLPAGTAADQAAQARPAAPLAGAQGRGGTFAAQGDPGSRETYKVQPAEPPKQVLPDLVEALAPVQLVPTMMERFRGALTATETGLSTLGQASSAVAGVVTPAFDSVRTAATGVQSSFNSVVSQITPFVQAFNPTAVQMFQAAMRDLNASIGQALVPVMHLATSVIRSFASVLNPVMERLTPVIQELADMTSDLVEQGMTALAQLFSALEPFVKVFMELERSLQPLREAIMQSLVLFVTAITPVLEILAQVLRVLLLPIRLLAEGFAMMVPVLQGLTIIAAGVSEAFKAAMGALSRFFGDMDKPFESMTRAINTVVRGLIVFAARLALMLPGLGGRAFVEGMVKGSTGGERKDATGMAAPLNAQITGLESISKTMTTAALLAGSGAKVSEKPEDIMKDIREDLRGMLATGENPPWVNDLVRGIWKAFRDEYPQIAAAIERLSNINPEESARRAVRGAFDLIPGGRVLGL